MKRGQIAAAIAAVAGITALDVFAGRKLDRQGNGTLSRRTRAIGATSAITIDRQDEEFYRFWRDLENLAQCMSHLESVHVIDDRRSRWTAKGVAGTVIQWEAEITEDRANELIAWRSVDSADVPNSGSVRFTRAPGDRGTELRVTLRYEAPDGSLGAAVAKLFGREPGQQIENDLRGHGNGRGHSF